MLKKISLLTILLASLASLALAKEANFNSFRVDVPDGFVVTDFARGLYADSKGQTVVIADKQHPQTGISISVDTTSIEPYAIMAELERAYNAVSYAEDDALILEFNNDNGIAYAKTFKNNGKIFLYILSTKDDPKLQEIMNSIVIK